MKPSLYSLLAVRVGDSATPSSEVPHPPAPLAASGGIIVGNRADAHVQSVLSHLAEPDTVVCVDASTLEAGGWAWADGLVLGPDADGRSPARGWLRRMAPGSHLHLVPNGSLEGAESRSRLQLLAAIASMESQVDWLTDYWTAVRAENKLVQIEAARRAGAPVPETRVVVDRRHLASLGSTFVIKPLGASLFHDDGVEYLVPATVVAADDPVLDHLGASPFIAQRQVVAARHWRIPTVGDQAWPCSLDAAGLPFDWRWHGDEVWRAAPDAVELAALALVVAGALGLGYTSQDWVEDHEGNPWLLDVNPGGEWLFCDDSVVEQVSAAIANWLRPDITEG